MSDENSKFYKIPQQQSSLGNKNYYESIPQSSQQQQRQTKNLLEPKPHEATFYEKVLSYFKK
jgi:hypothetical protein